ncbi:MAG: SPOR domain-containing protein [Alcanivorax sp.]|nr:SPOR domain-containing protein [Alcanivorax sp.]
MNRQVTQRIVGIILLLLLAAIVTPFLLRSPEEVRVALDLSLPPPPDSPAMAIEPVVTDAEVAEFDARISDERESVRRTAEDAEPLVGAPDAGEGAAEEGTEISVADVQDQDAADAGADRGAGTEASAAEPAAQLSGWAVQVGSFSRLAGAESLAQRLRDAGYRAFTRPFEQSGQTLHRVYLGPELDRDRARDLRERIAADDSFGLQGLVVSVGP